MSNSNTLYPAVASAIRNAENANHRWPCMADIGRAADEHSVDFEVLCAAFGILPAARDAQIKRYGFPYQNSFWHNAREVYFEDDRVGALNSANAVHAFSEFLKVTGIEPQLLVLTQSFDPTAAGDRAVGSSIAAS